MPCRPSARAPAARAILTVAALAILVTRSGPARAVFDAKAFVARLNAGYLRDLDQRDGVAATEFRAAIAAEHAHRDREAFRRYHAVVERLPDFAPALRRSCTYGFELGYVDLARDECERAVRLAPNISNKAALASILCRRIRGRPMTPDLRNRAIGLANELLVAQGPDRFYGLSAAAFVGEELGDRALLHRAVGPLARLAPHQANIAYYVARDALNRGDLATARRQLAYTAPLGRRINRLLRGMIWRREGPVERLLDTTGLIDAFTPWRLFFVMPIGLLLMLDAARRLRKLREARAASAASTTESSPPQA